VALRDGIVAAVVAAVVVVNAWGAWWQLAAGLLLTVAAAAAVRARPVWALLAGASANLVNLADLSTLPVWPVVLSIVACFAAGRRMADGRPAAPCFSAVAVAGLIIAVAGLGDAWAWITLLLPLALFGVLPWLAGRYARQRAALVEAGWQRVEQLERERRLVAEEARLRERARIARDMHDSLGHDLSLIALRAGALEIDPGLDGERRSAAGDVRRAAADATDRLREIIGVLGGDTDPAPTEPHRQSLADLVARTRDSGMSVTLTGAEAADDLPPMARLAAYRIVQEALTNAAKPGRSRRARQASCSSRATRASWSPAYARSPRARPISRRRSPTGSSPGSVASSSPAVRRPGSASPSCPPGRPRCWRCSARDCPTWR